MKATIWHNPACSSSRKTLALLQGEPDIELEVIEYLRNPPTRDRLSGLFATAGMSVRDGLRTHAQPAERLVVDLGLDSAPDDIILDAMISHPILINRPLVETPNGVRLCRPPERVYEIL